LKATFIQKWVLLSNKVESLNQRERLMVLGAAALLTYTVMQMLLLDSLETHKKRLLTEISTDQALVQELQQQTALYINKPPIDPDAQNKERIAELNTQLQALKSAQSQLDVSLISPEKMPELLRDLLSKNGKLKLIALNTLPTQNIVEMPLKPTDRSDAQSTPNSAEQNPAPTQEDTLFKHGVEITVEGRYLDLLEYVATIEGMHWHVLWDRGELTVKSFPNNQLKLTVYTLSSDKTWLSI